MDTKPDFSPPVTEDGARNNTRIRTVKMPWMMGLLFIFWVLDEGAVAGGDKECDKGTEKPP